MTVGQVFSCLFVLFRVRTLRHILDVEFFESNQPIAVDDLSSHLMNKIVPTVTNTLVDTRDHFSRLTTQILLLSRSGMFAFVEFVLRFPQSLLVLAKELRIVEELSLGKSGELFNPNVDAYLLLRGGERLGLDFTGETGKPFPRLSPYGAVFGYSRQRSMNNSFNVSNLGEGNGLFVEPHAIVVLFPGEAIVAAFAFETRIAGQLLYLGWRIKLK